MRAGIKDIRAREIERIRFQEWVNAANRFIMFASPVSAHCLHWPLADDLSRAGLRRSDIQNTVAAC